jgi:predicted lipoprotein with Yx(FWY)xxD motif
MKKKILSILLFSLLAMSSLYIISCSKDNPAPIIQVKLQNNATLGSILTDNTGRTLYYFANDPTSKNNCTSPGCIAAWPIFNVDNLVANQLDPGLTFTDFGSITTDDGRKQVTYKGRPLYYFAPNSGTGTANVAEAAGETKGEGVGNVWFVAKPDYSIMLTNDQLVNATDGKNYTAVGPDFITYALGDGKTLRFTDAQGLSLYTFKNDRKDKNNYTSETDAVKNAKWPIYETDIIVVPSKLDKSLFGSITVFGKKQLTYKGWPLYYYGPDEKVMGACKGFSSFWPVPVKDIMSAVL